MTLNEYILLALVQYGLPVLFVSVLVAAMGLPLPATLLLITAGSFVAQEELELWSVLALGIGAAVSGDLVGYAIGRWGSETLVTRLSQWGGGEEKIRQAEEVARRWGGIGVFLTRWLLTPLGPVINLTSGITRYPLASFLAFGLAGEALWVTMYVGLGQLFSDQVQTLSDTLGNFTWVILGLVVMLGLVRLLQQLGGEDEASPEPEAESVDYLPAE